MSGLTSAGERQSVIERFLTDFTQAASDTPAQRWLRANSAAINRVHAEMLAERQAEGTRA